MEKIYTEDEDKWHGIQTGPCGTEILTQLAADLQGIMSGETSVDEGLKEAEDYANGLLDEYWANKIKDKCIIVDACKFCRHLFALLMIAQ